MVCIYYTGIFLVDNILAAGAQQQQAAAPMAIIADCHCGLAFQNYIYAYVVGIIGYWYYVYMYLLDHIHCDDKASKEVRRYVGGRTEQSILMGMKGWSYWRLSLLFVTLVPVVASLQLVNSLGHFTTYPQQLRTSTWYVSSNAKQLTWSGITSAISLSLSMSNPSYDDSGGNHIKKGSSPSHGMDPFGTEHLKKELLDLCDLYTLLETQPHQFLVAEDGDERKRNLRSMEILKSETAALEGKIKSIIGKLAVHNPNKMPVDFWEDSINKCPLDGAWKLRFTTAEDAKPKIKKESNATSSVTSIAPFTYQLVNSTCGTITNIIQFNPGQTKSTTLRVLVKGVKLTPERLLLLFKTVTVVKEKDKRVRSFSFPFPRIPFSNTFLTRLAIFRGKEITPIGPYFDVQYCDDDIRIHKTGKGDYFVQSRLYEVWDPMVGWKLISMV